ncbi:MAG: AMP-dependent synthetase [Alphaproteobacteria bacterium]|nr:AMP-dependent synthetase [Alphaproteobacteria bacterium]
MSFERPTLPLAGRPASYRSMLIADGVRTAKARTPNKVALAQDNHKFTYSQLVDRFDRVSTAAMADLKLVNGDHAALWAPNCLEFLEIVSGLASIGVAPAMVPPGVTPREAEFICNDAEAKVLFVHESQEEKARSIKFATVERIIVIGKDYEDWLHRAKPVMPTTSLEEWDVFCIPYTSGTTGNPKGCLLSHRSRVLAFYTMGSEFACYSPDDRALATAPLYHGAGYAFAMAPIFFGGFCEILPKFDPEILLGKIDELQLTNCFFVPTYFHRIFALGPKALAKYSTKSLRTMISNAAPLLQATKEQIVAHFGGGLLHETYGSTEGGLVSNLRPQDQLRKEQCVGLPYPGVEIRVLRDDGQPAAPDEVGELFTRSPQGFNAYWRNDKATEEAYTADGWLTVGDMGKRDDEGYLYIVDRKKDMVISGGVNVFPREIEEILQHHPAIAECAVMGVPDPEWGEAVMAVVVRRAGERLTGKMLSAFCKDQLATYKVPKDFIFLDALPRNAAGKILKRELRDRVKRGAR